MELLHYRNDDRVVLCQVCYFFADRISKMAATGHLSLPLDPMGISLKNLFVRNYSTNWIFCIIWMFLGWFYTWSIMLVQIGNPTWLPGPMAIMCSDLLKLWRSSCQKLLSWWNCNIIEMMTGWYSTKYGIFVPITYPRWPPQGNNSLLLDPMGISFKELFFRNYLINRIFCIMWMFLGWFYTWYIILVQIGNPAWLPGPMCSNWLKLWRSSCQKLFSPWNCYIIEMMTGLSTAKFVIFLPIAYPRWSPQGNLVYHWTLWEFHWTTFLWETTQQIEYFTLYECSLDGSTPDLLFWCRSEIQHGCQGQ